jgi:hypothetical protein
MGKAIADAVFDAALAKLATSVNQTVCTDEPANFAGIAAVDLATSTLVAGHGNGDWTIANGSVSGRKASVDSRSGVSIFASGEADHIAYDDGSALLGVTTCTAQALTSGGTVTVPAHTPLEITDPT